MASRSSHTQKYVSDFSEIPVAHATEYVEVPIPEWGTEDDPAVVLLRHISQGERKRFTSQGEVGVLAGMNDAEREREIKRWQDWYDSGKRDMELLQMSYVRPNGQPLFSAAQSRELMERPDPRPWVRLIDAAERENLLTISSMQDFSKNLATPRSSGPIESLPTSG